MKAEDNLAILLNTMKPVHNAGDYVFCVIANSTQINMEEVILFFREQEGVTVVIKKALADSLQLYYSFVASWITLNVHSSLEAIGFTAAFTAALAEEKISCNVVAAFYHDHIFVAKKDTGKALKILNDFSRKE